MTINRIWEDLENDKSASSGLLVRRYPNVIPDVFVAVIHPEKIRCISASIDKSIFINISPFANLRDIQLEVYPDPEKGEKNTIVFKLLNNIHQDIFSVLCEDLMLSVSEAVTDSKLARLLLSRFDKWKSLFDKIGLPGITGEEQRGLFGELSLIRKLIERNPNRVQNVIDSWVGPEKQIKDCQWENWAIEVKSSIGNNHQKVHINNERQLDTSSLDFLFLYHLSLESRQKSGESLTQLIISISNLLSVDFATLNRFQTKLMLVGCFAQHYPIYESTGYVVRSESFYKVTGDFPRIEESDIRQGIGDLKYSIILSQCGDYIIDENEVLQHILPL